jgi:hypothetical protein
VPLESSQGLVCADDADITAAKVEWIAIQGQGLVAAARWGDQRREADSARLTLGRIQHLRADGRGAMVAPKTQGGRQDVAAQLEGLEGLDIQRRRAGLADDGDVNDACGVIVCGAVMGGGRHGLGSGSVDAQFRFAGRLQDVQGGTGNLDLQVDVVWDLLAHGGDHGIDAFPVLELHGS